MDEEFGDGAPCEGGRVELEDWGCAGDDGCEAEVGGRERRSGYEGVRVDVRTRRSKKAQRMRKTHQR